ncbi:MAG: rRNA maturation RNase YbeY [Pseudodonghicola sp.]
MTVDLTIEDSAWDALDLQALADRAAQATLDRLGLDPESCEVALLACDDARIAELNADFRGKPTPTNVLSWPAEDLAAEEPGGTPDLPEADFTGEIALGDIAIAYGTCAREAAEQGKPLADHCTHLIVHGLLHLLGYDHIRDPDATLMEGLEVEILGSMGLGNPYREQDGP